MNHMKALTILYIDDETCMRENVVEYLSYYCDHVYQAADGLSGLEVYKEVSPDIIITDITMPKLNGLNMVKTIRENDQKTKIIIATAHLENSFLLKAVELGLVKYLVKPITEEKLLPVLKQCAASLTTKDSIFHIDKQHRFEPLNSTLYKGEEIIILTKKELDFLELLISNAHRTVKYEEFNSAVWQGEMSEDAMRTTVKGLRRKISKESLKNISKIGYQIQRLEK